MRVALITPEYPGCGPSFGIGRYVADLAQALQDAGHQTRILAATDTGAWDAGRAADPAPLPHSLLLRGPAARTWLLRKLAEFRPDVVEVPNWGGLSACLPRTWPTVVRLCTSAGDAGGGRWDPLRTLRVAVERRAVARADQVIADSRAMAVRGRQLYGREADAVILHAWHGRVGTPAAERGPGFLFVGRWEPRKGVDLLLAAWPQVRAAEPDAILHLVGGGQPAGLTGPGIVAHGRLGDDALAEVRRQCRVQAVPSRFESFGIVVLEAWADGLVPVVSTAGALPEVVGEAGIVVADTAPAGLAAGLLAGLARSRQEHGEAGLRRLRERHDPRALLAATLGVYAAACGRRVSGP